MGSSNILKKPAAPETVAGGSPPAALALAALGIVLAALAAYAGSFSGPFIFDDRQWILENPAIRHLWTALAAPRSAMTGGRPVLGFSFALNYALSGTSVWSYHAFNLAIHALAGLALFGLVRRTLLQPGLRGRFGAAALRLAFVAAVLWTVHPLQTEAVTYVAQRAESLMGLFYLLTLYCFVRGTGSDRPGAWPALMVAACALGMATKEVMVTAPLMVLLYDRTFVAGSFRAAWRQRRGWYWGLTCTWLLLGYLMVGIGRRGIGVDSGTTFTGWTYALTECRVLVRYLGLAVWPHPLVLDYGVAPVKQAVQAAPFAMILAVLAASAAVGLWRGRSWGYAGAWFFVVLAPSSSVVPVEFQPMAEHRMYLPLAALIVVVVAAVHALAASRRRLPACLLVLAAGSGVLAAARNENYRSELAIWTDTAAKSPHNPRVRNNLGYALTKLGRLADARVQYEDTLRLDSRYPYARNNLGFVLEKMGEPIEAEAQYEEAVRLKPDYLDARNNLGMILEKMGREQEAEAQFEAVLELEPDFPGAHDRLGGVLAKQGRLAEAKVQYKEALQLDPADAEAHYNLGTALARTGLLPEAIEQFKQALQFKPDYFEACNNLGTALLQAGRLSEAIEQYGRAVQLKPDYATAHYNLGNALVRAGRISEAIEHYRQALRIKPDFPAARANLEQLQADQQTGGGSR